MPTSYAWHPIEDLEVDPKTLADLEMESLGRIWVSQKKDLIDPSTLEEFNKRLRREWSIETGVIENVYRLDAGVTRTLIEKGIDAALIPHGASDRDSELVARIIQDHYEALNGLFDFVGGQRQLSTSYIKELHAALVRNQETHTVVDQTGQAFERRLEKGKYKTAPNSPTRPDGSIHEYCPPENVDSEMDRLVAMYAEHENRDIAVEVEAAWLHHRFTQIHPFADGNGRVARALATLVFIKAGWFPLIVKRDDWTRYVEALEKADHEDIRPLIALFVEAQRNALILATEVGYDVRPTASVDEAIAAARDRLLQRGRLPLTEWLKAKSTADALLEFTKERLANTVQGLVKQIASAGTGFTFQSNGGKDFSYDQVRQNAVSRAVQVIDSREYNGFASLFFVAGSGSSLCLSFDAIGPRFRGMISVVAYLSFQDNSSIPIGPGVFQINYAESEENARARFSSWLEQVIVAGLTEWRRTL